MNRPYQEYKAAPDKWLGDIPAHWALERIKYGLTEKKSKKNPDLPPGAISYGKVISKDAEKIGPETRTTYQEVLAGEYLINPINLNYDLISLRTALSELDVCVSPAYIVLNAIAEKVVPAFGNYVLHVFDVQHMKTLGAGVRQTITFKDIGQCIWALPPQDEQTVIANFLDRETTQIDGLIEKKGRFIALLKEKRAAVITHAVTKGVDPGVAIKDACAPWIDSIPAHWDQKPFYAVARERKIKNKGMQEDNLLSLSYGNIVRKDINTPTGLLPESFETYQIVEANDVVFRLTDLQNDKRSLRSAICSERGIITSAYLAAQTEGFQPAFLNYLMRAYDVQKVFYSMGGGMRQSLGYEDIRRMPVVVPPIEEQTVIATFLDRETARIDTLISKTTHSIALLKEKRSALITAAVTGKIDVRDAA